MPKHSTDRRGLQGQAKAYLGCWAADDLGSIAPVAAPPGLRDREGAPCAPPPGLKEVNSWLLLRCIGRTGPSIMLSCLDGILLHFAQLVKANHMHSISKNV